MFAYCVLRRTDVICRQSLLEQRTDDLWHIYFRFSPCTQVGIVSQSAKFTCPGLRRWRNRRMGLVCSRSYRHSATTSRRCPSSRNWKWPRTSSGMGRGKLRIFSCLQISFSFYSTLEWGNILSFWNFFVTLHNRRWIFYEKFYQNGIFFWNWVGVKKVESNKKMWERKRMKWTNFHIWIWNHKKLYWNLCSSFFPLQIFLSLVFRLFCLFYVLPTTLEVFCQVFVIRKLKPLLVTFSHQNFTAGYSEERKWERRRTTKLLSQVASRINSSSKELQSCEKVMRT